MKHKCYSYFYMHGQFPLKILMKELSDIEVSDTWSVGDKKKYGSGVYNYSGWDTIKIEEIGDIARSQFDSLLNMLIRKESAINAFKRDYPIVSCVEIVPTLSKNRSMILIVPKDLLRFCYDTGSKIDVDYYVSDNSGMIKKDECFLRIVCKGRINNAMICQLSELDIFNTSLREYDKYTDCLYSEIELLNFMFNNTSGVSDSLNEMIDSVVLSKNALRSITMGNNLLIEVEIVAKARNQLSRPIVSPPQPIIELCNALDAGLVIRIN